MSKRNPNFIPFLLPNQNSRLLHFFIQFSSLSQNLLNSHNHQHSRSRSNSYLHLRKNFIGKLFFLDFSAGTLGTLVPVNSYMNLSKSVRGSTANQFVRTNSRFSTKSDELCGNKFASQFITVVIPSMLKYVG